MLTAYAITELIAVLHNEYTVCVRSCLDCCGHEKYAEGSLSFYKIVFNFMRFKNQKLDKYVCVHKDLDLVMI